MHQAEEDFDLLAGALRRQLAAHRWSGSCYRRFAPELSYGRHIWGATALMLGELLDVICGRAEERPPAETILRRMGAA